jgi:hypothetical protein
VKTGTLTTAVAAVPDVGVVVPGVAGDGSANVFVTVKITVLELLGWVNRT